MPHLRAAVTGSSAGFDASRSLLVLPVGGTTDLLLCAGADLDPRLDGAAAEFAERPVATPEAHSARLTGWERTNSVRAFRFKARPSARPRSTPSCPAPPHRSSSR